MDELRNSLLRPGDVFEKYTVEQELGHGSMGAVYLVRHCVLNTNFALKVLYPGVAQRAQQFVDRFIREAQLAGRIRHPNLIAVYDAGLNENSGMYYLVMDYVSGGSVRSKLRKQVHLSVLESLGIVRQVGHALEAALQHNMVHRDIKPENIMFDADGMVRLADLGIAKATGGHDSNLTVEAAVFSTSSYMSPEQARDSRNVDIRADIYSLGIVLFEMLTGRRPFMGENTIEILMQIINGTPAPDVRTLNPDIPEAVAILVADMIQKDLRKRVASPSNLISRIDLILSKLESTTEVVAEKLEDKKTMANIVQPVATMQVAELTMETVAQLAPSQPQSSLLQPNLTIAQPDQTVKKTSEPSGNQTFEPTVAIGTAETPSPSSESGGMNKRKMMIIGGAAVGLLLIVGGAMIMKGGKEPNKPSSYIETPTNNGGKGVQNQVETPQTTVPQSTKADVKPSTKMEEYPVPQAVVTTQPKVEEKVEPKVEEKLVAQTVQAGATYAEIQAKIAFFGAENTALLQNIKKMTSEQNTTFLKAGLSSRMKDDLMKLRSGKPDLLLIAVTSPYETMSLSNFKLFVADLCESLKNKGGNYAFVLEPIAGKSTRFCNGNNTVRDVCHQQNVNVIDCENDEIKADDIKMLLAP
jgi:serine/threonine-protein kinase